MCHPGQPAWGRGGPAAAVPRRQRCETCFLAAARVTHREWGDGKAWVSPCAGRPSVIKSLGSGLGELARPAPLQAAGPGGSSAALGEVFSRLRRLGLRWAAAVGTRLRRHQRLRVRWWTGPFTDGPARAGSKAPRQTHVCSESAAVPALAGPPERQRGLSQRTRTHTQHARTHAHEMGLPRHAALAVRAPARPSLGPR